MFGQNHRYAFFRNFFIAALIATPLACISPPGNCDSVSGDREREALARLNDELARLNVLINEAEALRAADSRIVFRYDLLRTDLDRVRAGIKEHIEAPRVAPRAVAPVVGDYR